MDRTRSIWLAVVAAAFTWTAGCGGSDPATPDAPVGGPDAATATDAPGPDASDPTTVTRTIGAAGGTIALGPVSIAFPAGAFAADTAVTLTRRSALFLAPSNVPDGMCVFSELWDVAPARAFVGAARPTLTLGLDPTAPSGSVYVDAPDVGYQLAATTRTGATATAVLDRTGPFAYGLVHGGVLSPTVGLPGSVTTYNGLGTGLTGFAFRPTAGGAETAATFAPAGELTRITVPDLIPGAYAVHLQRAPWQCGDVPGTFQVTGAQ